MFILKNRSSTKGILSILIIIIIINKQQDRIILVQLTLLKVKLP